MECIYIVLIFFHILVLQEYWVLTESRIPLKPVLGGVRIVAFPISFHEQTQCCFLILYVLSIFEGSVLPDNLEVTTVVVVSVCSW